MLGAYPDVQPGGRRQFRQLTSLTAYWLGLNILWGSLTTIVLPQLVEQLVPRGVKTSALALVASLEAVVAIVVQPVAGAASDRLITPWGRRRPLMLVGVVAQMVFLALLALSRSYLGVLVAMLLIEVASNTAQGPYQGLMPDVVPRGARGVASGFMGAGSLAGQVFGVAVAGAAVAVGDVELAIAFSGVAVGIGMLVTVLGIDEPYGHTEAALGARDWVLHLAHPSRWSAPVRRMVVDVWGREVLEQRDYLWLLASRLAILAATGTLQPFVYYLLEDSMGLGSKAGEAVAPLAGLVALVALASAVPGGMLTERFGRVRTVMFSAVLGGVGSLLFAGAPSYAWLFVIAVPFGLALGIFLSADWALLADIAPPGEAGRYLGLSNTVTAAASVLAVAIGGPLADLINGFSFGAGYRAVFVLAAIEFAVGAWCVTRVHEPAPEGA